MKMSTAVEWCVHAAVLMAQAPQGELVTRTQIAQAYDIPESYLAKHLKAMVADGILHAVTGPRGGYGLARPPQDISVLSIFEAVEGRSPAFVCTQIRARGSAAAPPSECRRMCAVEQLFRSGEQAFRRRLAESSVADLLDAVPSTARRRNAALLAPGRSGS